MNYNNDIQKLEPGNQIRLYELDATRLGGLLWRFHGHAHEGEIIWQGQLYSPLQITAKGFDLRGDGRPASPTLQVANELQGVRGAISALCLQFRDLVGAKVRVIETFRHYLDAANFPEGNPEASPMERLNISYINQALSLSRQEVTFECASPTAIKGQMLPGGQLMNRCEWCLWGEYRGEDCNYTGVLLFDLDGNPVTDPALDRCGGRVSDCERRHGKGNPLPFGGTPATSLGE